MYDKPSEHLLLLRGAVNTEEKFKSIVHGYNLEGIAGVVGYGSNGKAAARDYLLLEKRAHEKAHGLNSADFTLNWRNWGYDLQIQLLNRAIAKAKKDESTLEPKVDPPDHHDEEFATCDECGGCLDCEECDCEECDCEDEVQDYDHVNLDLTGVDVSNGCNVTTGGDSTFTLHVDISSEVEDLLLAVFPDGVAITDLHKLEPIVQLLSKVVEVVSS